MPVYQQRGTIPPKRHTAFRNPEGGIYYEELMGNKGFSGASSLLYRIHRPTQLLRYEAVKELDWKPAGERALRPHHFRLGRLGAGGDVFLDRIPILYNRDVALLFSRPGAVGEGFYRNSQADELLYVLEGRGVLESPFGDLAFGPGDYLQVPRGVVHRYELEGGGHRFLVIESATPIRIPARYRNENGQMKEGAPFTERDIRTPGRLRTVDETGEFPILTKQRNAITRHVVRAHPFDVVGWDGTYYPFAFNIHDFEPIVGRIHQPPPVHQTFEGTGFVVCSFVPRLFDFDPQAVPAPYNHSNVQSEEVLFYAEGEFMSRKGMETASMTYHPDGMPHGPQPGKAEASIGARETNEVAVMLDAFRPLTVAGAVMEVDDPDYPTSWLE